MKEWVGALLRFVDLPEYGGLEWSRKTLDIAPAWFVVKGSLSCGWFRHVN
jgi:hypothetical protein